jgi:hypothetical protein
MSKKVRTTGNMRRLGTYSQHVGEGEEPADNISEQVRGPKGNMLGAGEGPTGNISEQVRDIQQHVGAGEGTIGKM